MAEQFIGEIRMFGFTFAPQGWALCNGQLLPINQNQALFSLLGTTYGGDGITTFALPDLQGRVPMHFGNGAGLTPRVEGDSAGAEKVTLTQQQMPQHSHSVQCDGQGTGRGGSAFGAGVGETPVGHFPGLAASPSSAVYSASSNAAMNAGMIGITGGSQPFSVIQPFLAVNFCIALQGIFPSRS